MPQLKAPKLLAVPPHREELDRLPLQASRQVHSRDSEVELVLARVEEVLVKVERVDVASVVRKRLRRLRPAEGFLSPLRRQLALGENSSQPRRVFNEVGAANVGLRFWRVDLRRSN